MANLRALYPVSREATKRLRGLYPAEAERIVLRHLGSSKVDSDQLGPAPDPAERTLNFISVARVIPLKRVDLTLELVKNLARLLPTYRISWIHVGGGDAMVELTKSLSKGLPSNLEITLAGSKSNAEVHTLLSSSPFHWNVLLSTSEGGVPVALCEGASYGVPAVATAVGGISELVDDTTGVLVDADVDIPTLASKIVALVNDPQRYGALRHGAHQRWLDRFAASSLRQEFASNIVRGNWLW